MRHCLVCEVSGAPGVCLECSRHCVSGSEWMSVRLWSVRGCVALSGSSASLGVSGGLSRGLAQKCVPPSLPASLCVSFPCAGRGAFLCVCVFLGVWSGWAGSAGRVCPGV